MLIWTRHANFRHENDIYDPSARIIKNPYILQYSGRVNTTGRRVKMQL